MVRGAARLTMRSAVMSMVLKSAVEPEPSATMPASQLAVSPSLQRPVPLRIQMPLLSAARAEWGTSNAAKTPLRKRGRFMMGFLEWVDGGTRELTVPPMIRTISPERPCSASTIREFFRRWRGIPTTTQRVDRRVVERRSDGKRSSIYFQMTIPASCHGTLPCLSGCRRSNKVGKPVVSR